MEQSGEREEEEKEERGSSRQELRKRGQAKAPTEWTVGRGTPPPRIGIGCSNSHGPWTAGP